MKTFNYIENNLQIAINEAKKAFFENEIPVGCAIFKKNELIYSDYNSTIKNNDVNSHAEIITIKNTLKKIQINRFYEEYDLYTTIEPCLMCFGAIINARIKNLYIGSKNEKFGFSTKYKINNPLINIFFIENQECSNLIQKYFQKIRI